jgi:hypothetical protein
MRGELSAGDVRVRIREDHWTIEADGFLWVRDLGIALRERGEWLSIENAELRLRDVTSPADDSLTAVYHDSRGPCVALRIRLECRDEVRALWIETEALRDLEGTAASDSFLDTTFRAPILTLPAGREFLCYSWGLRDSNDEYPGGGWPKAYHGCSLSELPQDEPFAPLLLHDPHTGKGCVLSPASHELVSPLTVHGRERNAAAVAITRGLHGAIDAIPKGTTTSTLLVFSDGPLETLDAWGRVLLARQGKSRVGPLDHPVLRTLGFWNAYGGYYAELFEGLDEEKIRALARHFDKAGLPVGYFGLDLWYEFVLPGLARSFRPDPRRFPRGLGPPARETKRAFFLHLSALARETAYRGRYPFHAEEDEIASYPLTRAFYEALAEELARYEGANGVWHDWLRSQQFLVKRLRADLTAAEEWFDNVCRGLASQGLAVMLCMPTVGFLLASTRHPNVIFSRSYNDYLFKQPKQLARLPGFGELEPPQEYLRQDLLVGALLDALGLYPFYDLFISNAEHPEGFADPYARQEAWRRALSAGPVGFGDKLGCEDQGILQKLVLPDGTLCKPHRPPRPWYETISQNVLVAQTETRVGEHSWTYVQALNAGEEPAQVALDPVRAVGDCRVLIYDPSGERVVRAMETRLSPAEGRYWLLAPVHEGVAFLGLIEKFVSVPKGVVAEARAADGGWRLTLRLPVGHRYLIGAWSSYALELSVEGGRVGEPRAAEGGISIWEVTAEQELLHLRLLKSERAGAAGKRERKPNLD